MQRTCMLRRFYHLSHKQTQVSFYVTVVIVQHTPLSTGHVNWFNLTNVYYSSRPEEAPCVSIVLFYSCGPLQEEHALESG